MIYFTRLYDNVYDNVAYDKRLAEMSWMGGLVGSGIVG